MTCCVCGEEIGSVRGAAFEVKGFEEPRSGGGTNHVLWRERTGKVMCHDCLTMKKHNVDSKQMTL